MGKYHSGNKLDLLNYIANELAEANRLKRWELSHLIFKVEQKHAKELEDKA